MKTTVWKVWIPGVAIVMIACVMLTALAARSAWPGPSRADGFLDGLLLAAMGASVVAAFVVGYLAPRRTIFWGISIGILAAILTSAINFVSQALGYPVDFPGFFAGVILFVISLASYIVVCAVGVGLGVLVAELVRKRQSKDAR